MFSFFIILSIVFLWGCQNKLVPKVIEVPISQESPKKIEALGEKARGKIIFYNRPFNNTLINTFSAYGGCVDQRAYGAKTVGKFGALAVIVRSMTNKIDNYPHTGTMRYGDIPLNEYIPARIIKNSIFKQNNFVLINKGEKDGVKSGMGVIVDNGVIGIISITSENFSKVTSVLNQNSTISVIHIKSGQNGSLKWNTNNYMTAMINDIPNHANIQIGDTIQTNGFSSIFPQRINIATVISYTKGNENGLCNINIKFLNDMNTVKNVYIINSLIKEELEGLE